MDLRLWAIPASKIFLALRGGRVESTKNVTIMSESYLPLSLPLEREFRPVKFSRKGIHLQQTESGGL
jgi:hypothetical protein